jgi:branched-chain amino acid transport system permease protein
LINFAHGDLLLLGTYVAWTVMSATNSMLLAPVIVAAVGMVIERFTLRPIYDREPTLQFLLTFGLAEVLREGIQVVWGRQSKSFPIPSWGAGSVDLGLISYPPSESRISFDGTDTRHDEMHSTIEDWIDELVAGIGGIKAGQQFQ